jgi:16S rRNA processing protein RimM
MAPPELIIVGRMRRAHGVRGDLVVEPITSEPAEVFSAGRRLFAGTVTGDVAEDGAELTVVHARPLPGGGLVVGFDEIGDRTTAERWTNRYLLAPREELTPPTQGEVYLHELVGMLVSLPSGEVLGEVLEVYELPHGLMLDVRYRSSSVMLPYREEFVQRVDRAERTIVATPPEGLFE